MKREEDTDIEMMGKQEVRPGAKCLPLWDPFQGLVFRCVNPNGGIAVISIETFKQLESKGVVERGEWDTKKSMG